MKRVTLVLFLVLGLNSWSTAQEPNPTTLRLPWDDLKAVLQLDKNQVRLSWSEFQALLSRTSTQSIPLYTRSQGDVILSQEEFKRLLDNLIPPPTDVLKAVLTKGRYRALFSKTSVSIEADLELHLTNADRKPIEVDLFPGNLGFQEILLDEKPVLSEEKNGRLFLTTTAEGRHQLKLRYAVTRSDNQNEQKLWFPIARTPITKVEVNLPEPNLDVVFDQSLQVEIESNNNRTKAVALLYPTESVQVTWNPVVPASKLGPAKVYADLEQHMLIEDSALRVDCDVNLQVLQNTLNAIDVTIPAGFTVLSVNGDQIGDWFVKEENVQNLHIPFQVARKGTIRLNIMLEQIFTENKVNIVYSGLRVKEAIREKGFVGVELRTVAEVTPGPESSGIDRIDTQELPQTLVATAQRPLLFGFKNTQGDYHLDLAIERHADVNVLSSVIDQAQGLSWVTGDGKLVHQVTYRMRNTSKQFLEIQLPAKAQLWNAFVAGQPVKPSKKDQKILIPLNHSQGQSFAVELVFYEQRSAFSWFGRDSFQFPTVDMMVSQMTWQFVLPPKYSYRYLGKEFDREYEVVTNNVTKSSGGFRSGIVRRLIDSSKDGVRTNQPQKANSPINEPVIADGYMKGEEVLDQLASAADEKKPSGQAGEKGLLESGSRLERKSRAAVAGVLPIRMQIPVVGQRLLFSKTLVVKDTTLSLDLVRMPRALNQMIRWTVLFLIAGLLIVNRTALQNTFSSLATRFHGGI